MKKKLTKKDKEFIFYTCLIALYGGAMYRKGRMDSSEEFTKMLISIAARD